MFAVAGTRPGRIFRTITVATLCAVVPVAPGMAQFDFLFGFGKAEPKPPPAQSNPAQTHGNTPQKETAKHKKLKPKKTLAAKPASDAKGSPVAPDAESPPPPYDPELLRLAEILGALTYLNELCASNPSGDWRAKMQSLLEAEARTTARKERLAGSYNRGFRDYERTYHSCTQNAQAVISRFLAEGGKIAHEVVNRYGAS